MEHKLSLVLKDEETVLNKRQLFAFKYKGKENWKWHYDNAK